MFFLWMGDEPGLLKDENNYTAYLTHDTAFGHMKATFILLNT